MHYIWKKERNCYCFCIYFSLFRCVISKALWATSAESIFPLWINLTWLLCSDFFLSFWLPLFNASNRSKSDNRKTVKWTKPHSTWEDSDNNFCLLLNCHDHWWRCNTKWKYFSLNCSQHALYHESELNKSESIQWLPGPSTRSVPDRRDKFKQHE